MGEIAENKARISFLIDKSDKQKLEYIAQKQDRSVSYIINLAITKYLKTAYKE